MPDAYPRIRQAVIDRHQVIGIYNGHRRLMCPHVIGIKGGRRQALFYQFGGTSESGLGPNGSAENWRCIPVDELYDVEVQKGEWHTAPRHPRRETCVDMIDVEVAY